MRQMADRPGDVIVLPVVEYDRQSLKRAYEIPVSVHFFLGYLCGRREDIVSVFDEMRL